MLTCRRCCSFFGVSRVDFRTPFVCYRLAFVLPVFSWVAGLDRFRVRTHLALCSRGDGMEVGSVLCRDQAAAMQDSGSDFVVLGYAGDYRATKCERLRTLRCLARPRQCPGAIFCGSATAAAGTFDNIYTQREWVQIPMQWNRSARIAWWTQEDIS